MSHCRDCCCARAWKALGITEYTGKSIAEHIEELCAALETYKSLNKYCEEYHDCNAPEGEELCKCDNCERVQALDELEKVQEELNTANGAIRLQGEGLTQLTLENAKLREMWEYTMQVWEFSMKASPEQFQDWRKQVREELEKAKK